MNLFGVIALVLTLNVDGELKRAVKKAWKQTKQNVNNAIKSIVIEPVKDVRDIVLNNKPTSNIVDKVTQPQFSMSHPIVDIKHSVFDVTTKAEMKKNFEALGVFRSDPFIESCFNAEKQEKVVMKFYIPDVNAADNVAAVSMIGIEATKNEDNSVSVKAVDLSATCTVTAVEVIHWRSVVREFWNNHETKTQESRSRGLTGAEIQTLIDTLTKAIKDDPRYTELPGGTDSHHRVVEL
eukprot:gene14737-16359_t